MNDLNFSQNQPETQVSTPITPVETPSSLTDNFKSTSAKPLADGHETKSMGILNLVLVIAFLGLTAFGGFQMFQNSKVNQSIELRQSELERLRQSNLTDQTEVSNSLKASFLAQKKQAQLFWTNIIVNIETSLPNPDNLEINSIAGNEEGTVNVSINTTELSNDPFIDTANLITVFKTKPFFSNIFIPSINSSVTNTGQGQLTYNLRLDYLKETNETAATEITETTEPQVQTVNPDPAVLEQLRQQLESSSNEQE